MSNPKCDHYWLIRRGGRCQDCGVVFPGQMQPPFGGWPDKPRKEKCSVEDCANFAAGKMRLVTMIGGKRVEVETGFCNTHLDHFDDPRRSVAVSCTIEGPKS